MNETSKKEYNLNSKSEDIIDWLSYPNASEIAAPLEVKGSMLGAKFREGSSVWFKEWNPSLNETQGDYG